MTGGSGYFDYGASGDDPHPTADFLSGASDVDWATLFRYGERRSCQPGDVVVADGDESRTLVIVLSGTFRLFRSTPRSSWRSTVTAMIDEGSVFGEMSFIDGGPRVGTVVATEPSEVFLLQWRRFEHLIEARPVLANMLLVDLGKILAARLRQAGTG